MKKFILILSIIYLISSCSGNKSISDKFLKVSENGRYLEYQNGKPFLYLGCTAWELFHELSREEATEYMLNRSGKGFTVIQAVVLAELDGLKTPNFYGEIPLIDSNPAKPNEKYFEHVDYIVNQAEFLGLYIGMLPTWGDKVTNDHGGDGVIFTPENAKIYGEFLGKRYKNKPIIWILGGDRNVSNDTVFQIWKSMAEGLQIGDGGNHLISMHPRGEATSSKWFHNEEWLDFNIYQSGHARKFNNVYDYAEHEYSLEPVKPFIDGEPAYEDIAVKFYEYCNWSEPLRVPAHVLDTNHLIIDPSHFKEGFFTAHDVRVHAYWNFLSGACGYTYGNNAIWQMFRKGGSLAIPCLYDWRESMDRPGSDDIKHVRALFESRPFEKLIPDQTIISGENPNDSSHIRAAIDSEGSFLIAYMALGQTVNINMGKLTGKNIKAYWFNPREGLPIVIGDFNNEGVKSFTPPSSGTDNDWILVLDNAGVFNSFPGV